MLFQDFFQSRICIMNIMIFLGKFSSVLFGETDPSSFHATPISGTFLQFIPSLFKNSKPSPNDDACII